MHNIYTYIGKVRNKCTRSGKCIHVYMHVVDNK